MPYFLKINQNFFAFPVDFLLLDSDRFRPPIPMLSKKWPICAGITGRFVPESVADLPRIHWPICTGLCNKAMIVIVDGDEVLVANVDDTYYAIANKCTHAGGSLSDGTLEGTIVKCPKHGARFDLKTGKAVGGAKIGFMKVKVKDEKCYTVKVEGTDILVGKN